MIYVFGTNYLLLIRAPRIKVSLPLALYLLDRNLPSHTNYSLLINAP